MIIRFTLLLLCSLFISPYIAAQAPQGFTSISNIEPIPVSRDIEEKPQSKIWTYACTQWAVLPNSEGTHLWRLDGTKWTNVLTISTRTSSKADSKMVGDLAHVLLFRGNSTSYLISLKYDPATHNYILWPERESAVALSLQGGRGTATIDVDSKGRMWLASNTADNINVRWSDAPYQEWSAPITLATGVTDDDIGAVIAFKDKIGVFWSNQNAQRFGFRTHTDGEDPTKWSSDEVPASQSALKMNGGMADDHMNMALASDGTLYTAIKTNYDFAGYPKVALLIRRPSGTWDDLYPISEHGTRPIVILNEELRNLQVIYTSVEDGGDILSTESSISEISFSPASTLLKGKFNNPTSTKHNYTSEVVILATNELATNETHAVGVLLTTSIPSPECERGTDHFFTVYPNPFSASTTVYFKLAEGGDYTLTLYDSKGARIAIVGEGRTGANELNSVILDGNRYARGLYMIKLQTSGMTKSLKLVHER